MARRPSALVSLLVPTALAAAVSMWRLGAAPLTDSESFYAEIAREMHLRGDWLTPTFNFARFFDKPPLYYWLELATFRVLGPTELAARLPCAVAFSATVTLTSALGLLLFDALTGLLSGCLLACTMGFFVYSHDALIEPVLCAWITTALAAFLVWRRQPSRHAGLLAAYLAMALGTLTKGLTGIVFPAGVIFFFCALEGEWRLLMSALSPAGIVLFLLVFVPWHAWTAIHHPGYLWFHFIHEQFLRFSGSMIVKYHPLSATLFLLSLIGMIFPWSLFLPQAIVCAWKSGRERRPSPEALFLIIWSGLILAFFCASRFKLDYYSIPAWPPLMLLIGHYLVEGGKVPKTSLGFWLPAAVICAIGLIGLTLLPWLRPAIAAQLPDPRLFELGIWSLIALSIGGASAAAAFYVGKDRIGVACLGAMMLPAFFLAERGISYVEPEISSVAAARAAGQCLDRIGAGEIVQAESDEDIFIGGVVFYTGRKVWLMKAPKEQNFPFPHRPEERFYMTPNQLADRWNQKEPLLFLDDSGNHIGRPWENDPKTLHLVWKNRRQHLIANQAICGAT